MPNLTRQRYLDIDFQMNFYPWKCLKKLGFLYLISLYDCTHRYVHKTFFLFIWFHCMIVPIDIFTKHFLFYLSSLYECAHGNAHKSIYVLNSLHGWVHHDDSSWNPKYICLFSLSTDLHRTRNHNYNII